MSTIVQIIVKPEYRPFSIRRRKDRVRVLSDDTVQAWTGRYWSDAHILSWQGERNLRAIAKAVRQTRKPVDGTIVVDMTETQDPASAHGLSSGLTGHEWALAEGYGPMDGRGESWPVDGVNYLSRGRRAPGAPVTCPLVGTRRHDVYLASLRGGAA